MGVSLTPLPPPEALEEVALLDAFSGVLTGALGAGLMPRSTQPWRAYEDSYPKFREYVDVVLKAWTDERLYKGQYCQFDDGAFPKPLQDPHLPTWVATTSRMYGAGQQGHSILMDPHATHEEIGAKRRLYEDELTAGHVVNGRDIPVARNIALGNTQAEAEDSPKGAEFAFGNYLRKPDQVRQRLKRKPSTSRPCPRRTTIRKSV